MTAFTPEQLEQVKPDWSVRQIIEFGKEPLSIDTDADGEEVIDSDSEEIEETDSQDAGVYMTAPELETGRTQLMTCDSLDDLIKNREVLENAFNDMKQDKNFAKKKIRFTIQADALTLGDMEDRETCSLFSNLLDNAVEAADRVEEGDRWITVKMRKAGDMIFIELSNSMTGRPSVKDNRLVTTKREGTGHGLGLKSAERVVEKYGGSLVCEYGDGVFTVLVSFLEGLRDLS